MNRDFSLIKDDKKCRCANCGSNKDLELHHIVPLSLGGNDIETNLVCLCYKCHSLIHFEKRKTISHSQCIKNGIAIAKANGVHIGRNKTSVDDIPQEFKKYYEEYKQGKYNKIQMSKITGLSRPSIDKYIKIIEICEV